MHLLYVIDRCFIFPSHLCYCITTTLEITEHEFTNLAPCSNRVLTSLGNSGLCWTVFAKNRDTVVPAERNGDLQTLTCVLVARPRQCLTLSNPVPWQNWMADYLGYTLRMKTLFCGWPVMLDDTHTRRRLCPTCWQLHSVVFVSLRLYEPGHLLLPGVSIHTTMVGSRRDWWTEVAIARLRLGGRLHRCISCCPNLQILTEMWHSVTTFAQRISLMIIWLLGTIPNRQASFYRLPCLIG